MLDKSVENQNQNLELDLWYVRDSVFKILWEMLWVYRINYSKLVEELTKVRKINK